MEVSKVRRSVLDALTVTYNEIRYSMPVLDGAALELVDVAIEVGLVEVEVASVVDGFAEVVDVKALVELGFDASVPGMHWPENISEELVDVGRTYCSMCSVLGTRSLTHMKFSPSILNPCQRLPSRKYDHMY
jgi:hypothetical protein